MYVSPNGEVSASRICWDDLDWDATVHPETQIVSGPSNCDAKLASAIYDHLGITRDGRCGAGADAPTMCSVEESMEPGSRDAAGELQSLKNLAATIL